MTATIQPKTAFLNLLVGGTGALVGREAKARYEADGRRFPAYWVHLDTDPNPEAAAFADHRIHFPLSGGTVEVVKANAARFGPVAEAIVKHFGHLLHPEHVTNGSRTTRALTQLAFICHRHQIARELRSCIIKLKKIGGFDHIIPVLVGSSGGGAGSALLILLPLALRSPSFRARLTEGIPEGELHTPIAVVVEPFAYAIRHKDDHATKVLANAYAFRCESALLERLNAYSYIHHIGFANTRGAVLDTPEQVARVVGLSLHQYEREWAYIKGRNVDTIDGNFASYAGVDVYERLHQQPSISSAPELFTATGDSHGTHRHRHRLADDLLAARNGQDR